MLLLHVLTFQANFFDYSIKESTLLVTFSPNFGFNP